MTSCLTQASLRSLRTLGCASKLIAPRRIASSAAVATPQMLERLRQCPALQGSRLIKRAGLEQRQAMLRIEDELAATVDAGMAGDLIRAADDSHLKRLV